MMDKITIQKITFVTLYLITGGWLISKAGISDELIDLALPFGCMAAVVAYRFWFWDSDYKRKK
jgi:hypothetical protein